jgi:type IV pilus assembly protein PilW
MIKTVSRKQGGFSLIELMIALVLGLILTAAALSVVVTTRQTFRTVENHSRMQENARTAFELMARDIRAAAGNPCGANQITNNLTNNAVAWWANFNANSLRGFDNSAAGDAAAGIVAVGNGAGEGLAGSDALIALTGNQEEAFIVASHNSAAAPPTFTLSTVAHNLRQNDIAMVCDGTQASIFQVTNNPSNLATIAHDAGGAAPGNIAATLGRTFDNGALLGRYTSAFWYVGANGRGGNSLFRRSYDGNAGAEINAEIVDNVTGMDIEYVERNTAPIPSTLSNWLGAGAVTNWNFVLGGIRIEAVRVTLNLRSRDNAGVSTAGQPAPLTTTLSETVYLRNREFR